VHNKSLLDEREKYWIKKLNCIAPYGYNCSYGGEGGDVHTINNFKHTRETKEKIRAWNKGKNTPQKTRDKQRKANIGRVLCKKTKLKISNSCKNRKKTEEHKKKISESIKKWHKNKK